MPFSSGLFFGIASLVFGIIILVFQDTQLPYRHIPDYRRAHRGSCVAKRTYLAQCPSSARQQTQGPFRICKGQCPVIQNDRKDVERGGHTWQCT